MEKEYLEVKEASFEKFLKDGNVKFDIANGVGELSGMYDGDDFYADGMYDFITVEHDRKMFGDKYRVVHTYRIRDYDDIQSLYVKENTTITKI